MLFNQQYQRHRLHQRRNLSSWFLALLGVALAVPLAARAQLAPYHRWRTLETPHFHVHVPAGLEREGRVAGAAAEKAYEQLARELRPPRGTIDLVVADDADYSNGNASAFPSNRIVVYAVPPVESSSLRLNEDWLGIVITHELAHIFHLDRVSGVWSVLQHIFGRAPQLFPNSYGPSWLTEGLAVYYESRFTQGGRLRGSEHSLLARTSAMEHQFPSLDQLSLGSPLFPGGERAYAYGSLFVDYLAKTYGDTAVTRLVREQSGATIPFSLNRAAKYAFGTSLSDAFDKWRATIEATAGELSPPLPGWRQLTVHPYYALEPRWLTDSTLVYAANNGRSTSAAYRLSLDGTRRRISRRNGLGANVPLADGGLLFAQVDYTARSEVRSDLYIERDGRTHRLTRGMRLVQPDARVDGEIVAVQLAPTRADLVLLDRDGRFRTTLTNAGLDETWSEPRWSPSGQRIAAIHRTHGGLFSLVIIDAATGAVTTVDRQSYVLSAPSWTRDELTVLYMSDPGDEPKLTMATLTERIGAVSEPPCRPERERRTCSSGLFSAEESPTSNLIAGVTLRADGFHVGISPVTAMRFEGITQPLPRDSVEIHSLAAGDYHKYSPWRSLMPRYWYPVIEAAPSRGTRLGAETNGRDALNRHIYSGYFAVPTTGSYPTGSLFYRYAGFRKPLVDAQISQDYNAEFSLVSGGTADTVGTLLRRIQDAALAATWVRPRVRTFASASAGLGFERRSFMTDPGEFLAQLAFAQPQLAETFYYPRAVLSAQWSNLQRPSLSISAEDGVSLAVTARERIRTDSVKATQSTSVVGTAGLFKSLDLPGFAHHVLALRLAGGWADRRAATALEVGGTSGSTIELLAGYAVGEGRRTFGVRGFPTASISGTRAAAASLEYRAPFVLSGRGWRLLPFFFDRSSLSLFADAGNATCGERLPELIGGQQVLRRARYDVCSPSPRLGRTIASVGAEAGVSAAVLDWDFPQLFRFGVAVPVAGRELVGAKQVSVYVAYGQPF